jgi:hypothetical protein
MADEEEGSQLESTEPNLNGIIRLSSSAFACVLDYPKMVEEEIKAKKEKQSLKYG